MVNRTNLSYAGTLLVLKSMYPKIKVIPLSKAPWYLRLVNKIRPGFIVTIRYNIYMEDYLIGTDDGKDILWHEVKHVGQFHRWGWIFLWTYAYPSWAFMLPVVIFSQVVNPDLLTLLVYLAHVVFSQFFRGYWEFDAYEEDLRTEYLHKGYISNDLIHHIASQFWSSGYLYMFPFPPLVYNILNKKAYRIHKEPR